MSLYTDNLKIIDWSVKIDIPHKNVDTTPIARGNFPIPRISGDYEAYECPVTGKMIEGRAAHGENLKQTGCRLLENGEFEDNKKNGHREYMEGIDAAVDKAVDEVAKDYFV